MNIEERVQRTSDETVGSDATEQGGEVFLVRLHRLARLAKIRFEGDEGNNHEHAVENMNAGMEEGTVPPTGHWCTGSTGNGRDGRECTVHCLPSRRKS